jgi:hypothetical protein
MILRITILASIDSWAIYQHTLFQHVRIDGYKEIRDSFSDWKLSLTTLKLRDKIERYEKKRLVA